MPTNMSRILVALRLCAMVSTAASLPLNHTADTPILPRDYEHTLSHRMPMLPVPGSSKTPEAGSSSSAQAGSSNNQFTYQACAARGARLYQMMIGNIATPETPFEDFDDLKTWGWRVEQKKSDPDLSSIMDDLRGPLQSLGISGTAAQIRKTTHARETTHGGNVYRPTGGHYHAAYFPDDNNGAILAWDIWSPANVARQPGQDWGSKPVPLLSRFSDVVFLNWESVAGPRLASELKYVVEYPIINPDTRSVVRQALIRDGVKSGEPGAWPGRMLRMKGKPIIGRRSDAFEAVLGTPNVNGVVWMLRQHGVFEGKVVTGIQVWRTGGSGKPGIVVHIGDGRRRRDAVDAGLVPREDRREGGEVHTRNDLDDEGYWSDIEDKGFTTTESNITLTKRIPPSKAYSDAILKGRALYARMTEHPSVLKSNPLSRFSLYSDLSTNGWTIDLSRPFHPEQIGAVEKASQALHLDWQDKSKNEVVLARHPATGGYYANIFNVEQGVIYAFDRRSPAYQVPKGSQTQLPQLQHYSDVAYLTWAKSTSTSERQNLKFFFSVQVQNPSAKSILTEALEQVGVGSMPVWPGYTFTPEGNLNAFLAVLATDNVKGVARMLAEHRGETQLGFKTVSSITVWRPMEGAESRDPTPAVLVRFADRGGRDEGSGS